jgi:hypothetical protein
MDSKVAIMQPYIFPYMGYMSLVHATDIFVFYDDVTFIKQGWINRNRILLDGEPQTFTVPLVGASSNRLIHEVQVFEFEKFKQTFLRRLKQTYCRAPCFAEGIRYVENVLAEERGSISAIAQASVQGFFELLGFEKKFLRSSVAFPHTKGLDRADRLIEITRELGSSEYVNPVGGETLYEKGVFSDRGINLRFLQPVFRDYFQPKARVFVAGLSVIDAVMNLPRAELRRRLDDYIIS